MDSNDISWKTINCLFKDNPQLLVKHHIDSYNNFFNNGIKEIFKDRNPIRFFKDIDEETEEYKYECNLYLGGKNADKIYYGKPIIYDNENETERIHYMYPNEARLRNMSYKFTIHYDVDVEFKILIDNEEGLTGMDKFRTINKIITLEKILLGRFPIMLQSDLCLLKGLNPEVRYNLGECKNDNGGYFIIDGKEKVIVSQETRADNQLYILEDINDLYSFAGEIRSVSEDASKPNRTLSVRIVRPQPSLSNNNIVVNIPQVRKPVPLFILMRALGVISDKEIINTCLLDMEKYDNYIEHFRSSIHDAGNIFTQEAALKYIATLTKGKSINHVLQILMNYLLPHIGELNFKAKSLYIGYIVKRLLNVKLGVDKPTNRDSYQYKRIEVSGILMHKLFQEYYKKQQDNIYLKIDKEWFYKHNATSYQNEDFINLILQNKSMFFSDRIVETGFNKAFKGDWGSEAHTKRPGIVQDLTRLSYFSFLCQLRKTNLHISSDGAKIVQPRLLNSTQIGLLCPIHSPDGGNVGLHKHMSTSLHITSGCSAKPYIEYLRKLDNQGIKLLEECSLQYLANATKIFLNGAWLGCTHNPMPLINIMKLHRRNNLINIYTSIHFSIVRNEIHICTDAGRATRPLFYIMNNMISYEREKVLKLYQENNINWDKITRGFKKEEKEAYLENDCEIKVTKQNIENLIENASVIEYLDTQETEGIVLAHSNDERDDYKKKRITHCEIHPSLLLSIMANQTIFPENNPYPRNAFSCGQAKQGVSLYHSNFNNRIDKTSLILNYGQMPLTKSRYLNLATKEQHPYGENAIVAIMCYSGYNVEDAIIVNEGALKRGLFRTTYYNMYEAHEEIEKTGNIEIAKKFMNINNNNVLGLKPGYDYSKLDEKSGIIRENSTVDDKTVVIGMASNNISQPDSYIDNSVITKKGQVGIIDKSFMTKGEEGKRIAKIRVRGERIPDIGDKFCSRAGQKGTIGMILPECDMPCTEDGIRPDIIVNPHAMPSRMTIGHLVETIISKVGGIYGAFGDCTAFQNKGSKHKEFGSYLTKAGYHASGNEILYNGMTGEQLETEIYFGPTYYLRLKHMPKDKINYRARGPRTVLTRQTVQGRANNGGLRIGEMDRDCLIAHGLSSFIQESMLVRGDEYFVAICNKTGCIAAYNETKQIFLSPMADGPLKFTTNINNDLNITNVSKFGRDFSVIRVPYAFKLLMQELKTMNVQMRVITESNVDQLLSLTEGDDVKLLTGLDSLEDLHNNVKNEDYKSISSIKEKTPIEEAKDSKPFLPTFKHKIKGEDIGLTEDQVSVLYDDPVPPGINPDLEINIQKDDIVNIKGQGNTRFKIVEEPEEDDEDNEYMVHNLESSELIYVSKDKIVKVLNKNQAMESPDYYPESPDYDAYSPPQIPYPDPFREEIQEGSPLEEEAYENEDEDQEDQDEDEKSINIKTERQEDASISKILDKVNEEESDEIVKTVAKINEEDTTGLDKLATIDEEEKSVEEKEKNENTKSVTAN